MELNVSWLFFIVISVNLWKDSAIACILKFHLILYIIPLDIGKSPKIISIKAFTK